MKTSKKKRIFFDSSKTESFGSARNSVEFRHAQKSLISDRGTLIWIISIIIVIALVSNSSAFFVSDKLLSPGADVKIKVIPDTCGKNICGSNESCSSCPSDCGSCSTGGDGGSGGSSVKVECNDEEDNDDDGKCDYNGCIINNTKLEADPGCKNIYDNSELDLPCSPDWQCNEWGQCIKKTLIQKRICFDINYCNDPIQKTESQSCFVYVEPKKCIFLFIPCWLWIIIILILIASAIYYYYKKKKELREKRDEKQEKQKPTKKQKEPQLEKQGNKQEKLGWKRNI